jgi:hypothetical protein
VLVVYYDVLQEVLVKGVTLKEALDVPVQGRIARMKEIPPENADEELDKLDSDVQNELRKLIRY